MPLTSGSATSIGVNNTNATNAECHGSPIAPPMAPPNAPPAAAASSSSTSRSGWAMLRATRSASKAELAGEGSDQPLFYSILVHNLSHSDLMLGLKSPPDAVPTSTGGKAAAASSATSTSNVQPPLPPSMVARPKFSRFKQISGRLLTYVENQNMQMTGIEFPSPLAGRFSRTSPPSQAMCPYGFRVKDGQMKFQDWDAFKLKGDDIVANAERMPKPEVIAAYFPMLAVLIPRWLNIVAGKNARRGIRQADQNKKVLFLISGAGTPWNTEHDASGNSTKGVAKLATWFLNHFYPEIEVHTIHSGVEIFHYDANVSFVNKELKPRIEEVRRILAEKYFDKWPKYMHLATTLTDGASARISAINASLRHLKPDCLHMWQLKSFWHEYPFVTGSKGESDVEFHEFEKLEMTPPTLVSETDNWTKMLVREMIAHKEEFERVRDNKERYNELDTFWLRKSKQPVLSVLMVKKKNKAFKFFRGINVEVSMPTGSLCSERNAIGSALSSDPSLCRKDLRMIAVLALGLEPHSTTSSLSAQLPIPKELVPVGHTPLPSGASSSSPSRVPMSPRGGVFAMKQEDGSDQQRSTTPGLLSAARDDAMDESVDLPMAPAAVAGRPNFTRAQSERSMLTRKNSSTGANSNGGASSSASSYPPPTSPALRGGSKQNSYSAALSLPPNSPKFSHTNSPSSAASRAKSPAAGPVPMEEDLPATQPNNQPASTSNTPRKRKAAGSSTTGNNLIVSPLLYNAGAGGNMAPLSPLTSTTPPILSPRLMRSGTTPAKEVPNLSIPSSAVGVGGGGMISPRVLAKDLSSSSTSTSSTVHPSGTSSNSFGSFHAVALAALAAKKNVTGDGSNGDASTTPPAVEPSQQQWSSPRMQTRGTPSKEKAAGASTTGDDNPRDRKRVKRTNSQTLSSSSDAQSSTTDTSISLLHGPSAQDAYVKHEMDLIRARDAMMLPPGMAAQLSGNTAPNAIAPVDRCLSEDPNHHGHLHSSHVTDERNPINPCGSCNEWLKKVAEVNPDFKVVTFTSTDCSTCFIKAVKF